MARFINSGFVWGVTLVGLILAAPASASLSSAGDSRIVFKATGPAGLSFEGKGRDVRIKEDGNNIVVSVKLDGLATGIDLRDRHMKEKYLETGKYPVAILEVDKSKLRFPDGAAVNGTTDGRLTLHGVSKAVKVSYKADGNKNQAKVEGSMRINMKDFKIEVPSYLGVTVKPNVDVEVKLGVVDK